METHGFDEETSKRMSQAILKKDFAEKLKCFCCEIKFCGNKRFVFFTNFVGNAIEKQA